MVTRITHMTPSRNMGANLQKVGQRLYDLQEKTSTGKLLNRPSDDPARATSSLEYRSQLRRSQQLGRNADDARSWLTAADIAINDGVEQLTNVRTLLVQAINGSNDSGSRTALSVEIRERRKDLLALANSPQGTRPLFAGTSGATDAFDNAGQYIGDAGVVNREVGDGVTLQVNALGDDIYGVWDGAVPEDGNVFQVLDYTAARIDAADTAGMTDALTRIDAALERMQVSQVELGSRARQLEDVVSRQDGANIGLHMALSEVEDVDIAQAIVDLRAQELAYQSALGVTARVIQPSLMDFLR